MKRSTLFWIFVISLFIAIISSKASAQTAAVSATITDGSGQAYANGTWQATLTRPAGLSVGTAQRKDGVPLVFSFSGVLDATGTFAATMPRTDMITPAGFTWMFSICPNTTYSCSTLPVSLTSGTVDLSASLSAAVGTINIPAAALSDTNKVIPRAYKDAEIVNPVAGSMYFNTLTGNWRGYDGLVWNNLIDRGKDIINAVTDCGVATDRVSDICTTLNACIVAHPQKKIILPSQALTLGARDYFSSCRTDIATDGVILASNTSGSMWPGTKVRIDYPSGITGVRIAATCDGCGIEGINFFGGDLYARSTLTTWEDWANPSVPLTGVDVLSDGVQVLAKATLKDVDATGFKRHCFYLAGNAAGQPDLWELVRPIADGCRGYGIYTEGSDANVGLVNHANFWFNGLGANRDGSFYGNTWLVSHSSGNGSDPGVAAGANKTVTGTSVAANVKTINATAHGWTLGQWVTDTGSVDATYNGTCKLTIIVDANNAKCNYTHADGSTTGGTAATSSSAQVVAYYAANSIKMGSYISTSAAGPSLFITPYIESTSGNADYGIALILNPQGINGGTLGNITGNFIQTSTNQMWFISNNITMSTKTGGFVQILDPARTVGRWAVDPDVGNSQQTGKFRIRNPMSTFAAYDGSFEHPNGTTWAIKGRNNAGTLNICELYTDTSDLMHLCNPTGTIFDSNLRSNSNPATTGGLRLSNGDSLGVWARNNANGADIRLISVGPTDKVALGDAKAVEMQGAPLGLSSVTFATLPASPNNGYIIYCSDCTLANPTASGGTGALVKRINGAWVGN